jgi:DNA processing protein
VAIVGARRSTPTGSEIAWALARDLAREGLVIVSGLARGIDRAAHEGALAADGATIAVLGCGVDVCYPPDSRSAYEAIRAKGLLLSEFEAGEPPRPAHFPQRNRLIAALAEVIVVVEGAARSGSRITADFGLELGREVVATPRDPIGSGAEMPNGLLRQGAAPITCASDVLEILGLPRIDPEPARRGRRVPDGLRWAWQLLDGNPRPAEVLSERCGRAPKEVAAALVELELLGFVERAAGGLYRRRGKR